MRACNRFFLAVCMLIGLVFMSPQTASAQGRVADYLVETFSGGFNSISGTGSAFSWTNPWYGTQAVSLPFNFKYDGQTVNAGTLLYAGTNGVIKFGSAPTVGTTTIMQGNATYPAMLSFMNGYISSGNYHDWYITHYYQTQGVSPNRVLIFEIRDIHSVGAAGGTGSGPFNYSTHVQIKLYESTNVIEYLYSQPGRSMGGNYYTRPSIGLNGYTTPTFSFKTVATNVGTVPSLNYRFTPPPPPAQLSVQPKVLAFGNVSAGSPSVQCITVRSVGTNPLTINGASISGTADFTIASGPAPGTVLAPGGSASYCIAFDPLQAGPRNSILTIVSNGADSGTQQVNLTGIGIAPDIEVAVTDLFRKSYITVGDSLRLYIPYQSTGTGPLRVLSLELEGATTEYTISDPSPDPLPVGEWDTIEVIFHPTFQGRQDAILRINSNSLVHPQITVRMFGTAIIPRLTMTPSTLDFDSVAMGETVCKTVTLFNPGTDTVNILRMMQTYSDPDFTFNFLTSADTMIMPEQQKSFEICFTPRYMGTRVATVRLYSDLRRTIPGGIDTSQFILDIMGTGVPSGDIVLNGRVDSSVVGIEKCVTDQLRNIGSADITITNATIIGADAAEYTLDAGALPFTLKPGETRSIAYCLTPTERGLREASISITGSTASKVVTMSLPLTGFGLEVCAISDPSTAFNETVMINESVIRTITVTNCGDVATTFTASLPSGTLPYTLAGPATSGVVQPGGTATFDVAFTPDALGAATSTLTIVGDGPGSQPMEILLLGSGAGVAVTATGGSAGTVEINDCEDFTVVLNNNGNIDWTPGAIQITGPNAADFTFVSLDPQTIAGGASGTLTLRYCPTAVGTSSAMIGFPSSTPATILPFGYNISGVGQQSVRVPDVAHNGYVLGQTYPNPLVNATQFDITIPSESHVSIDLFDQTGKLVRHILSQRFGGTQSVTIEANDLPAGTYSYVMISGDIRLVRQLTIVR